MKLVAISENGVGIFGEKEDEWVLLSHDLLGSHCTDGTVNGRDELCVTMLDGRLMRRESEVWKTVEGFESSGNPLMSINHCPGKEHYLYVGMRPAKVRISRNNGDSWRDAPNWGEVPGQDHWVYNEPPYMASVSSVQVLKNRPEVIFANICWGGVIATPNGGKKWATRDKDLARRSFTLRLVPGTKTLWAGTDIGIYCSTDFGKTWKSYNSGLPYLSCRVLTGLDANPEVVVAVVHKHQDVASALVVSDSHGEHWQLVQGLPSRRLDMGPVMAKFIEKRLFVGFRDGQVWCSKDLEHWSYVGHMHGMITAFEGTVTKVVPL